MKLREQADVLAEIRSPWSRLCELLEITGLERTIENAGRMELLLACDKDILLKLHLTEFIYRIGESF